jgi:prepilin-type N-terminal cleavage/methylation domain-containing protein
MKFSSTHTKTDTNKKRAGFTLIELLVVIAIIGILSAVVITNLTSVRAKGRDGKRISDIKQLQLALETFAERCGGMYPVATSSGASPYAGAGALYTTSTNANCVTTFLGDFISIIPRDPVTGVSYFYTPIGSNANMCYAYHLGTSIEGNPNELSNDADAAAVATTNTCGSGITDFTGSEAAGTGCYAESGRKCYDFLNQ